MIVTRTERVVLVLISPFTSYGVSSIVVSVLDPYSRTCHVPCFLSLLTYIIGVARSKYTNMKAIASNPVVDAMELGA